MMHAGNKPSLELWPVAVSCHSFASRPPLTYSAYNADSIVSSTLSHNLILSTEQIIETVVCNMLLWHALLHASSLFYQLNDLIDQ